MGEMTVPEGYMEDSRGRLVPLEHVSDYDKLKDETVNGILARASSVQQEIKDFKTETMGDVYALMEVAAEKYSTQLGGQKGNVQLVTYDGKKKVQLAISEALTFDERLQIAKQLIDECIIEWTKDGRSEVKTIVNAAFDVDKQGNISTTKVLSLLKLEINDSRWQQAMKAVRDSLSVQCSKKYIRFYHRTGTDEKWQAIPLDIAAV